MHAEEVAALDALAKSLVSAFPGTANVTYEAARNELTIQLHFADGTDMRRSIIIGADEDPAANEQLVADWVARFLGKQFLAQAESGRSRDESPRLPHR
jgi:hypothetical protein